MACVKECEKENQTERCASLKLLPDPGGGRRRIVHNRVMLSIFRNDRNSLRGPRIVLNVVNSTPPMIFFEDYFDGFVALIEAVSKVLLSKLLLRPR